MYLDIWVCREEESIPGDTNDLDVLAVPESTLVHMFEDSTVFPADVVQL